LEKRGETEGRKGIGRVKEMGFCFAKKEDIRLVNPAEGPKGANCRRTDEPTAIPGEDDHGTEGGRGNAHLFKNVVSLNAIRVMTCWRNFRVGSCKR
jgi:hypothetical protein